MKRWLVSVAVVAACGALPACGGTQRAADAERPETQRSLTPAEVVAAGKGIAEQYRQAYEVRSFEALAPLYLQNLDVAVVHQGTAHHGWTAVDTYLKGLLARAAAVHIKLEAVTVTALGPRAATVVATMRREINDGTTAVVEQGTLTLAARLERGSWVIVTEHFSYPPR